MDDRTRLLCLGDICPDLLQQHLASKDELKTYAEYKAVINDYLIERRRWSSPGAKGKVNWLGVQDKIEEQLIDGDDDGMISNESWVHTENHDADMENIMTEVKATVLALVKGKLGKKGKGKGGHLSSKGANRDGGAKMNVDGDPKCFECGESIAKCGHSARDCPIRKARIAAGGPERLPKGKGKGKGGKGEGWPSRSTWNTFYPGPSQAQWRGWYPQQPQQPPPGKLNLFEQPMQLSAVSPLQALLSQPGALFGINPKYQVKDKPMKTFEHVNKYEVLDDASEANISDGGIKMEVKLMDAVKKPSLNRMRKAAPSSTSVEVIATPC